MTISSFFQKLLSCCNSLGNNSFLVSNIFHITTITMYFCSYRQPPFSQGPSSCFKTHWEILTMFCLMLYRQYSIKQFRISGGYADYGVDYHMTIICLQLSFTTHVYGHMVWCCNFFIISRKIHDFVILKAHNKMESLIFSPSEHLILFYESSLIAISRNLISQRSTILWLSL